ncbi:AAA family ATPase [Corynebacterium pseudotuberculosis]|uniref:AAA family ATPase n=1 Tax=Corynebacterium pseudotuberculosis TaxID=1719 RepID=UPI000256B645|nr:AAA family ATPase [Corynebacterium pseudotuberculosis]AFF21973.1 ATP-binding protein [Corynebacterium pseudotuberculosis P54B96]
MRIHAIEIQDMRSIGHLELQDLPGKGVIVISGDNELGKSTIMEAIAITLGEQHSTGKKNIRDIKPVDKDVPTKTSLTATIGPYTFTISKTWNNSRAAELVIHSPNPGNYSGREAENKLSAILDEHLDVHLRDALFMEQGRYDVTFAAAGIPSLSAALGSGESINKAEDNELISAVEKEYKRYYSGQKIKKNGELDRALNDLEKAQGDLDEVTNRSIELEGKVSRISAVTQRKAAAEEELPHAKAECVKAQEKWKAAQEHIQQIALAQSEADRLHEQVENIERLCIQRKEKTERQISEEAELDALKQALAEEETRSASEEEHISELNKEKQDVQQQLKEARELLSSLRKGSALAKAFQCQEELNEITAELAELDKELDAITNFPRVTDAQLEDAERAYAEYRVARELREASAASVAIRSDEPASVTLDGIAIDTDDAPQSFAIAAETVLKVGSVEATFSPGSTVRMGNAAVEESEAALKVMLGGATDLEELRNWHRQGRIEESKTEQLLQEKQRKIAETEALKRDANKFEDVLEESNKPDKTVEQFEELIESTQTRIEELGQNIAHIEILLTPWLEGNARKNAAVKRALVEEAEKRVSANREELQKEEKQVPFEELEKDLVGVRKNYDDAVIKLETLSADADSSLIKGLFEGAQAKVADLERTILISDADLRALEEMISLSTGVSEKVDVATAAVEVAERRLNSVKRRAEASKLLFETLVRNRDEARRQYAQPFVEQLVRLAAPVFGTEVSFSLDENLSVVARTSGNKTVAVKDLSGGAQEQLAILTRFAVAGLVSDESVPVFVDDALGSTDTTRQQLMAMLFSELGKRMQVFVLTCVPDRYSYVVGKHQYEMAELLG